MVNNCRMKFYLIVFLSRSGHHVGLRYYEREKFWQHQKLDSKHRRGSIGKTIVEIFDFFFFVQHASAEVERMLIGNKCDMQDKRQVSREKGEQVRNYSLLTVRKRKTIVWSRQTLFNTNETFFFQLATEYGIKFMETSAKGNIVNWTKINWFSFLSRFSLKNLERRWSISCTC